MATVSVTLDRELEAKVKKFANGVGVDLDDLLSRALVFALKSRYPVDPGYGQGAPARPDQGLPPAPGTKPVEPEEPDAGTKPVEPEQPEVDNELPGRPARPDQGLPPSGGTKPAKPRCPVFDPKADNELPEGEVPVAVPV